MTPLLDQDGIQNPTLMGSHIPTVTEHDLTIFYQEHFANGPSPSQFPTQPELEVEYEEYEDEDDGLGYYPDGVKRTLTDEQIAMFRHSEIQALIKEREAQSPTNGDAESSKNVRSETGPIFAKKNIQQFTSNQPRREKRRPRQAKSKRKAAEAALEEQKRRRRNSSSDLEQPRKKQEVEEDRHDPEDFLSDGDEKTYRRKAREADEIKETMVELDY